MMNSSGKDDCVLWASGKVGEVLCILIDVLSSNFAVAFVSSFAGAVGGAIAAYWIIERNNGREAFLSEMRNTNAAIMVSFSMCNTMLSLKKQHSLPLYKQFKSTQSELAEFEKRRMSGQLNTEEPFEYVADFKTFHAPTLPIDTLENLVFQQLSVQGKNGRLLSAVSALEGVYVALKEVLIKREKLVEQFKTSIAEEEASYYYFGRQLPSGHINQEYPDNIDAIHSYVDDVIFFSFLIGRDLAEHGKYLLAKEKRFSKVAPKVTAIDFGPALSAGLIPPDSAYSGWFKAFGEREGKS